MLRSDYEARVVPTSSTLYQYHGAYSNTLLLRKKAVLYNKQIGVLGAFQESGVVSWSS